MVPKTPGNHLISVRSKTLAVEDVYEQILTKLKNNHFSPEDIFAIHLALEEAFTNAIKHGNKMDECKKVEIDYSITSQKAEISVADEGDGFEPEAVPDPRCGENLYKTGGRGLFLIRSYMDSVRFNESGNRIHMVKNKSRKHRSGK